MQVRKRNGKLESFDNGKIQAAIFAAMETVLGPLNIDDSEIEKLSEIVEGTLKETYVPSDYRENSFIFNIENIQDAVVSALQVGDYHEVATAYTRYRTEREMLRPYASGLSDQLSDYILYSKYSRTDPSTGKLIDWDTIVDNLGAMWKKQVKKTIQDKLPFVPKQLTSPTFDNDLDAAIAAVRRKDILPSMRSLQFAGVPIEVNNSRMYNCSFKVVDNLRFFGEAFFLLLSGCGVGYSVQQEHVNKLPELTKSRNVVHHIVEDTIEGWQSALDALIYSYCDDVDNGNFGYYAEFDYSAIRAEGSLLKTSGGKAPGHIPLKDCIESIRKILDEIVDSGWTPFLSHRIVCTLAEAVLAGGIRRSSLICLFDEFDTEMFHCKSDKSWFSKYPELRLSNNSVAIPKEKVNDFDWKKILTTALNYGEPGFFIQQHLFHGTNPCGEIGLDGASTRDGYKASKVSPVFSGDGGFSFCNLTSINCSTLHSEYDFLNRCKFAALIGTIQATFTEVTDNVELSRLDKGSKAIIEEDALLGVSLGGIMDCPISLDGVMLRVGAGAVVQNNIDYANYLGINPAARTTTVKPEGTSSLLLGGISNGTHPHHSSHYFRRVKANPNESCAQLMMRYNPHMVTEISETEWVITFPIVAPDNARAKEDWAATELLDFIKNIYLNWVLPGTYVRYTNSGFAKDIASFPSRGITHNVSSTVTFKKEEMPEIVEWLEENYGDYGKEEGGNMPNLMMPAIAFMSWFSDKAYPNMPFEAVTTEADAVKFNSLIDNWVDLPYGSITNAFLEPGSACEGPSCEFDFNAIF